MIQVLAAGGLLTLLIMAGFGAGFGWVAGARGARLVWISGLTALFFAVALLPVDTFRATMQSSLAAGLGFAQFLFPILAYATLIRWIRRKAAPAVEVTTGLRRIDDDAELLTDYAVAEHRFSLIWRDNEGAIDSTITVRIIDKLAHFTALNAINPNLFVLVTAAEAEARDLGATHALIYTHTPPSPYTPTQIPDVFERAL